MIDIIVQRYGPGGLLAFGVGGTAFIAGLVVLTVWLSMRAGAQRAALQLRSAIQQLQSRSEQLATATADNQQLQEQRRDLERRVATLDARCERLPQLEDQVSRLQEALSGERRRTAELQVSLDEQRKALTEKLSLLETAREELTTNFENLANRILDEKSARIGQESSERLVALLNPVKEQMSSFQRTVLETHREDTKERSMLREQIKQVQDLNRQLSEDALNLTRALKGDSKVRGDWGELSLTRILEAAGLTEGREFVTQTTMRDADDRLKRPDVIIQLPEGKQVVVDSKVTLNAYTELCEATDEVQRAAALKRHLTAMRTHVTNLGRKDYTRQPEVDCLEFVLMFVPLEGAYIDAVNNDPDLFDEAFRRHRVAIVCPATLYGTLKTIAAMWRMEHRNRNAEEIARQAGALYDKFVGFVEALEGIGNHLERAQKSYGEAINRLSEGKDNLVRKTERLRELGADATKELPPALKVASG